MGLVSLQIAKPAVPPTRGQSRPSILVTLPPAAEGTTDTLRPNQSRADVQTRKTLSPGFESSRFASRTPKITLVDAAEVAIAVAVAQALHLHPRDIGAAATHQVTAIEKGRRVNLALHTAADVTTTSPVPSTVVDTPRTTIDEVPHVRTRLQGEAATIFSVREDVVARNHRSVRNLAAADATLATLTLTTAGLLPEAVLPDQTVDEYPEAALAPLVKAIFSRYPGPLVGQVISTIRLSPRGLTVTEAGGEIPLNPHLPQTDQTLVTIWDHVEATEAGTILCTRTNRLIPMIIGVIPHHLSMEARTTIHRHNHPMVVVDPHGVDSSHPRSMYLAFPTMSILASC